MKITVVSDLHLEFGYQHLEGGDVLVVAGDACEYHTFKHQFHSTRQVPYVPGTLHTYDFWYHECAKYRQVFYVLGNHEHYRHRFDQTHDDMRALLPQNVRLLENEYVVYEGVLFLGATLWTDFNGQDPIVRYDATRMMNDYRAIKTKSGSEYHKLRTDDTLQAHLHTKAYFGEVLAAHPHQPTFVITHHAPSFASVAAEYEGSSLNGAYASDLSNMILDNPQIAAWAHGHMHSVSDYVLGSTRVICNPRGYVPYERANGFVFNLEVSIDA